MTTQLNEKDLPLPGDEAQQPLLPPPAYTKRKAEQPRFTKLTLPPEFDDCSLVTRLWLQSRLPTAEERGKKEKEREKKERKEKERKEKKGSRAGTPGGDEKALVKVDEPEKVHFRTGGRRRPVTVATMWLWLDLARALSPYLKVALKHAHPLRLAIYVLKMVIDTLQPTAKLYAQSQLYDLVEGAIAGKPASWSTAIRLGSAGLMFRLADELMDVFFNRNNTELHEWVEFALEKAYLTMQLDSPLNPSGDLEPVQIYEAGVFTGLECAENYNDGPWGLINGVGGAFAKVVDVTAKITMLYNALRGGDKHANAGRGGSPQKTTGLGTQSGILLALAFAPTLLQYLREKAWAVVHRQQVKMSRNAGIDPEIELEHMSGMATQNRHKQEVILFGLRDWVLSKWEVARELTRKQNDEEPQSGKWINHAFGSGEDMLRTIFYVLLATKSIDTGLGLGAIHLYQNTASTLMWSFRSLKRNCDQAWQSIFFAAAFVGALEPVQRGPMIDYDTVRVPGGMRIEARNLAFTYTGAPEPTLHGINLVVERGETLAIVGYNGGGKTTLVKVLMGLYLADNNGGQLLFNEVPVADFDPSTVHRRQSALFQDFSRYEFTLKDNVALGDVTRIDDTEAIMAAIEAGGAKAVCDKVGLECPLDPYGEPRVFKGNAINWYQESRSSDSDDEDDEDDEDEDKDEDKDDERDEKDADEKDGDAEDKGEETPSGSATPDSSAPSPANSTSDERPSKKKRFEETALSGGQWQRVGLARAFMRAGQADLVVFDEPSAALDPRAEAELFSNIHGLSRAAGATTIYISHRFNTVRKADKIALVENGTIAEYGSHAELMELKGQYYDLFMTQAEGYVA